MTQADPVTVLTGVKIFHTKMLVALISIIRLLRWNPRELEFPQCHSGRRKREELICQERISSVLTVDTMTAGEKKLETGWAGLQFDQACLVLHNSCPLLKSKPHARTLKANLESGHWPFIVPLSKAESLVNP